MFDFVNLLFLVMHFFHVKVCKIRLPLYLGVPLGSKFGYLDPRWDRKLSRFKTCFLVMVVLQCGRQRISSLWTQMATQIPMLRSSSSLIRLKSIQRWRWRWRPRLLKSHWIQFSMSLLTCKLVILNLSHQAIDHFQFAFCVCAKLFLWKCVLLEGSFSCKRIELYFMWKILVNSSFWLKFKVYQKNDTSSIMQCCIWNKQSVKTCWLKYALSTGICSVEYVNTSRRYGIYI